MTVAHRPYASWRAWVLALISIGMITGAFGFSAPPAQAVSTGPTMSNGWMLPAGKTYQPSTGFLANDCGHPEYGAYYGTNSGKFHTGADLAIASNVYEGDNVFPLAAGTVIKMDWSTGWSAPGKRNNVGLFVRHAAPDGTQFVALYGHIVPAKSWKVGDSFIAGTILGKIGDYGSNGDHLHFGMYPGANMPASPYGSQSCSKWGNNNGAVDPLAFLNAHPNTLAAIMRYQHQHKIVSWNNGAGKQATSWIVLDGKRYWVEDIGTFFCARDHNGYADHGLQSATVLNVLPDQKGQHASPKINWSSCIDFVIVQWANGGGKPNTSWAVIHGKRYWIKNVATFNCLKTKYGYHDRGAQPASVLNALPDQKGHWVVCNA